MTASPIGLKTRAARQGRKMVFQFVEYSGLVHLFPPVISKGSKQACIVEFFLGASGAILEILHQWHISLDFFFIWKLRFQVICTFFASLTCVHCLPEQGPGMFFCLPSLCCLVQGVANLTIREWCSALSSNPWVPPANIMLLNVAWNHSRNSQKSSESRKFCERLSPCAENHLYPIIWPRREL